MLTVLNIPPNRNLVKGYGGNGNHRHPEAMAGSVWRAKEREDYYRAKAVNHSHPKIKKRELAVQTNDEPLVLTPNEARKLLRCSRGVLYDALRRGTIPSIRISPRKILIPRHAFMKWLNQGGVAGRRDSETEEYSDYNEPGHRKRR